MTDNLKVVRTISFDPKMFEHLTTAAKQQGINRSELVRRLIDRAINKEEELR